MANRREFLEMLAGLAAGLGLGQASSKEAQAQEASFETACPAWPGELEMPCTVTFSPLGSGSFTVTGDATCGCHTHGLTGCPIHDPDGHHVLAPGIWGDADPDRHTHYVGSLAWEDNA